LLNQRKKGVGRQEWRIALNYHHIYKVLIISVCEKTMETGVKTIKSDFGFIVIVMLVHEIIFIDCKGGFGRVHGTVNDPPSVAGLHSSNHCLHIA
jgi:hypothetical protein